MGFPCVQERHLTQAESFSGGTYPMEGRLGAQSRSMAGFQSSTENRFAFYQARDGAFGKRHRKDGAISHSGPSEIHGRRTLTRSEFDVRGEIVGVKNWVNRVVLHGRVGGPARSSCDADSSCSGIPVIEGIHTLTPFYKTPCSGDAEHPSWE